MALSFDSERSLDQALAREEEPSSDVFQEPAHLRVQLSRFAEDPYISRSQAQRLLQDLKGYRRVVLDFKDVVTVGQAFVDEVFRVYASEHTGVELEVVHANEDVRFMIENSLSPAVTHGAESF